MAETIPGGAFLQSDKETWVNAQGKKIAAPRGPVYVRPEEEILSAEEITPGSERLLLASSEDEYGEDPDMVTEESTGRKKVSRKKS